MKANMNASYLPSDDVIARDIEGELIIVPLVSGIGDAEDELFTLNRTGRVIWECLDGRRSLRDVAEGLADGFNAAPGEIEEDVKGFVEELLKRRMLVQVKASSSPAGRKKKK